MHPSIDDERPALQRRLNCSSTKFLGSIRITSKHPWAMAPQCIPMHFHPLIAAVRFLRTGLTPVARCGIVTRPNKAQNVLP